MSLVMHYMICLHALPSFLVHLCVLLRTSFKAATAKDVTAFMSQSAAGSCVVGTTVNNVRVSRYGGGQGSMV